MGILRISDAYSSCALSFQLAAAGKNTSAVIKNTASARQQRIHQVWLRQKASARGCPGSVFPALQVVLALQRDFAAVRLAFAMRSLVLLLAGLFASAGLVRGEFKTPENAPIEITSTGQTTYENGLATARDNVAIHVGDTDIYADYAQYNPNTHDVELRGHVRIYRGVTFYLAESGIYNVNTKQLRAINGQTESEPYFLSGENVTEISDNAYLIKNGTFTTHDALKPDFHFRARTIRVYNPDELRPRQRRQNAGMMATEMTDRKRSSHITQAAPKFVMSRFECSTRFQFIA